MLVRIGKRIGNRLRAKRSDGGGIGSGWKLFPRVAPSFCSWQLVGMVLSTGLSSAQDALRNSLATQAPLPEPRTISEQEFEPYTFKTGDLNLLVARSAGLDWN